MPKPHFTIKNIFQKQSKLYKDILTKKILSDVCKRITGRTDYTVEFDDNGYNKGRLATLEYAGSIHYISFSKEEDISSRNSFFQSFPTALVKYHQEANPSKHIYFYFLEHNGNIETPYFIFMYRLMKTAGTIFLNERDYITKVIPPFNSVDDIVVQRDSNRSRNSGNASSYVTINENDVLQIFGKTYGASKYETTLLCLAVHALIQNKIELYEIQEGNLKKLPKDAREVIISLGITVITSDLSLEKAEFETNDSLRSPTYIYNLLVKLGDKKCALCDCEIPQIIQGAHIWPVASIKRLSSIDLNEKLKYAMDGDNGLWLCNNHHKLYDMDILYISKNGRLKLLTSIEERHEEYLLGITTNKEISGEFLTPNFIDFLKKRNGSLNANLYSFVK